MVGKIARVKIKMVISLVKLSFLFNSEIKLFHRYLYTYSRLNQNQQKSISKVLSNIEGKVVFDKGKPSENTNSNNSVRSIASCEMNPNLSELSSTTSTSSMTSDTKMSSLFYGNTNTFTEELLILTILSLVRKDKVMIPNYK
jgi:hypothetical protein